MLPWQAARLKRVTVEDKCAPHYKYLSHLNSVKLSGNDLLMKKLDTARFLSDQPQLPNPRIVSVTQLFEK